MNIAILSSEHHFNDDRLYYHFAKSLIKRGHKVNVTTSEALLDKKGEISITSFDGIKYSRKEKIKLYIEKLTQFKPEIILCSEPITILAAKKYSKNKNVKIIFDITEYYPSKNKIAKHKFGSKLFFSFIYFSFFLYACHAADSYIIGEYYKGLIPKKLFPNKKRINISYYPSSKYITKTKPNLENNVLKLCYTGYLSIEKGFTNFLNVLKELSSKNPKLEINVKLIGNFNPKEKNQFFEIINCLPKKISLIFHEHQKLDSFVKLINNTDVFLDLRSNDFINSHCLPIKLFYFMALERPVIHSNLKAIRKEVQIDKFGYLVDPTDYKKITSIILNYLNQPELYYNHCTNARKLFELNYNWATLEKKLTDFIESTSNQLI